MKFTILVAAATVALGGCASTEAPTTEQNAGGELIYRTGSNIPVRVRPLTEEEKKRQVEESQRSLQTIQRGGAASTKQ